MLLYTALKMHWVLKVLKCKNVFGSKRSYRNLKQVFYNLNLSIVLIKFFNCETIRFLPLFISLTLSLKFIA